MTKPIQTSQQLIHPFNVGDKVKVISVKRDKPYSVNKCNISEEYPEDWWLNELRTNDEENLNQIGTIVEILGKDDPMVGEYGEYGIEFKTLPNWPNGGDNLWPAKNLEKVA